MFTHFHVAALQHGHWMPGNDVSQFEKSVLHSLPHTVTTVFNIAGECEVENCKHTHVHTFSMLLHYNMDIGCQGMTLVNLKKVSSIPFRTL